jgi:hypothetical protein
MLATDAGEREATPDDVFRREVIAALAALGQHLLAASRALDSPEPRGAQQPLREAARILAPFLT